MELPALPMGGRVEFDLAESALKAWLVLAQLQCIGAELEQTPGLDSGPL